MNSSIWLDTMKVHYTLDGSLFISMGHRLKLSKLRSTSVPDLKIVLSSDDKMLISL